MRESAEPTDFDSARATDPSQVEPAQKPRWVTVVVEPGAAEHDAGGDLSGAVRREVVGHRLPGVVATGQLSGTIGAAVRLVQRQLSHRVSDTVGREVESRGLNSHEKSPQRSLKRILLLMFSRV